MTTSFIGSDLSADNNHTVKPFQKHKTGLPPINNSLYSKDKILYKSIPNMKRSISLENIHMKKSVSLDNMNSIKKTPSLEHLKRFVSSDKLDTLKHHVGSEKTNFKKSISMSDLPDKSLDYVEKIKDSATNMLKLHASDMMYDVAKDSIYDIAKTNLMNASEGGDYTTDVKKILIDHITHDSVLNTIHTVQNIITHHP